MKGWATRQHLQDKMWIFAVAGSWLTTGLLAFIAIRNGNVEAHQQWMTRNYALTCLFITARIVNAFPIPDKYETAPAWILFVGTLLFAEVCISWRSTFTDRRAKLAKSTAAAAE